MKKATTLSRENNKCIGPIFQTIITSVALFLVQQQPVIWYKVARDGMTFSPFTLINFFVFLSWSGCLPQIFGTLLNFFQLLNVFFLTYATHTSLALLLVGDSPYIYDMHLSKRTQLVQVQGINHG